MLIDLVPYLRMKKELESYIEETSFFDLNIDLSEKILLLPQTSLGELRKLYGEFLIIKRS